MSFDVKKIRKYLPEINNDLVFMVITSIARSARYAHLHFCNYKVVKNLKLILKAMSIQGTLAFKGQ